MYLFWKHCLWFYWCKFTRENCYYSFMFLVNVLKIILNVRNRIWTIRQIKFIIPTWSRYFKLIVVIWSLNVFWCLIILTLANAIFLLWSSRLRLAANVSLNLWGSWVLWFPFFNFVDEIIIDCFDYYFF